MKRWLLLFFLAGQFCFGQGQNNFSGSGAQLNITNTWTAPQIFTSLISKDPSLYVDARSYGVLCGGAGGQDNAVQLQNAANTACNANAPLFIPSNTGGSCYTSATINAYCNNGSAGGGRTGLKLIGVGGICNGYANPSTAPASCIESPAATTVEFGDGVHVTFSPGVDGVGVECDAVGGCANGFDFNSAINLGVSEGYQFHDTGVYPGHQFTGWGAGYQYTTAYNLGHSSGLAFYTPLSNAVTNMFACHACSIINIFAPSSNQTTNVFDFTSAATTFHVVGGNQTEMPDVVANFHDTAQGVYSDISISGKFLFNPQFGFACTYCEIMHAASAGTGGEIFAGLHFHDIQTSSTGVTIPSALFDFTGLAGSGSNYGQIVIEDFASDDRSDLCSTSGAPVGIVCDTRDINGILTHNAGNQILAHAASFGQNIPVVIGTPNGIQPVTDNASTNGTASDRWSKGYFVKIPSLDADNQADATNNVYFRAGATTAENLVLNFYNNGTQEWVNQLTGSNNTFSWTDIQNSNLTRLEFFPGGNTFYGVGASSSHVFQINGSSVAQLDSAAWKPSVSGALGLGDAAHPWNGLYRSAIHFASLPTPASGLEVYCDDCQVTTAATCSTATPGSCVCKASGNGAMAKYINYQGNGNNWYCQ